jgi:hypothetical protein
VISSVIVAKGKPFASVKSLFVGLIVYLAVVVASAPMYKMASVVSGVIAGNSVALGFLIFTLGQVLYKQNHKSQKG